MSEEKVIELKVFENKNNKQKTIVLPKKIVGDIDKAIFNKSKRSIFFK